jgi:hypothetical protein
MNYILAASVTVVVAGVIPAHGMYNKPAVHHSDATTNHYHVPKKDVHVQKHKKAHYQPQKKRSVHRKPVHKVVKKKVVIVHKKYQQPKKQHHFKKPHSQEHKKVAYKRTVKPVKKVVHKKTQHVKYPKVVKAAVYKKPAQAKYVHKLPPKKDHHRDDQRHRSDCKKDHSSHHKSPHRYTPQHRAHWEVHQD